jgi:hypothetical protein
MKFMSGWTWYCEYHDSFGMGDTEIEVQHMANAHMNFYLKSGNPCQLYVKNQGEPSQTLPPSPPIIKETPKPSNYMARVKENFERAWQRWDKNEDLQLRENFDSRKDLKELTILHQRAEGGIVARLKKLELLESDIEVQQAFGLLANKHEKLIKRKTYAGKLKVVEANPTAPRVDRGKDSFTEYGMVNPPPAPLPDLRHTSMFTCSICNQPVIGNSCHCRGN